MKGHVVTATGSSKKIAKNLAAKMMLDKLEEVTVLIQSPGGMNFNPYSGQVEGQSKLVQNTKKKVINVNDNYVKTPPSLNTYNYIEEGGRGINILQTHQENTEKDMKEDQVGEAKENRGESFEIEGLEKLSLETAKDPKKHSMGEVVFSMMKGGGDKLEKLLNTDIVGSGYQLDCCSLLGEVAAEHNLNLTYRLVKCLGIDFLSIKSGRSWGHMVSTRRDLGNCRSVLCFPDWQWNDVLYKYYRYRL